MDPDNLTLPPAGQLRPKQRQQNQDLCTYYKNVVTNAIFLANARFKTETKIRIVPASVTDCVKEHLEDKGYTVSTGYIDSDGDRPLTISWN